MGTGGGGAPGRTEIALALAWIASGRGVCTLVDADLSAPGLAVRLGIPPRPDLADAVDSVHESGTVPEGLVHPAGRLRIVIGSHRPGEPPLRAEPVFDVLDSEGRVVGKGHCYDDACSYRADFGGVSVDESLRWTSEGMAVLGSKSGPGFSVVWKETLRRR